MSSRRILMAFWSLSRWLSTSFCRNCTCSRSLRIATPARTATSTSLWISASRVSTASMVFIFSCSVANCQKYCSTVFSTSFSDSCSCSWLTSSPTLASLLPLMICPPAKTGCIAMSEAMVPFFIMEMLMGLANAASISGGSICGSVVANAGGIASEGLTVVCAIPLLALNQSPVALTSGKYLVKASLRCCCAASMSRRAFLMAILLCSAESLSCCKV